MALVVVAQKKVHSEFNPGMGNERTKTRVSTVIFRLPKAGS